MTSIDKFQSLGDLAKPQKLKKILLEIDPAIEEATEIVLEVIEGNDYNSIHTSLMNVLFVIDRYIELHPDSGQFTKIFNVNFLKVNELIIKDSANKQLEQFAEFLLVIMTISPNRNSFIEKIVFLPDETIQVFLEIVDKYIAKEDKLENATKVNLRRATIIKVEEGKKEHMRRISNRNNLSREIPKDLENEFCSKIDSLQKSNDHLSEANNFLMTELKHATLKITELNLEIENLKEKEVSVKYTLMHQTAEELNEFKFAVATKDLELEDLKKTLSSDSKRYIDIINSLNSKMEQMGVKEEEYKFSLQQTEKMKNKLKEMQIIKQKADEYDALKEQFDRVSHELELITKEKNKITKRNELVRAESTILNKKVRMLEEKLVSNRISCIQGAVSGIEFDSTEIEKKVRSLSELKIDDYTYAVNQRFNSELVPSCEVESEVMPSFCPVIPEVEEKDKNGMEEVLEFKNEVKNFIEIVQVSHNEKLHLQELNSKLMISNQRLNEACQAWNNEVLALRDEKLKLMQKVATLEAEVLQSHDKLEKISRNYEDSNSTLKSNESKLNDLIRGLLNEKIEILKSKEIEFSEQAAKIQSLSSELISMKEKIAINIKASKLNESKEIRFQIIQYSNKKVDSKELEQLIDALNFKINIHQSQLDLKTSELTSAKEKCLVHERKFDSLSKELQSKQDEVQLYFSKIELLTLKINDLQAENEKLCKEIEYYQTEHEHQEEKFKKEVDLILNSLYEQTMQYHNLKAEYEQFISKYRN